MSGDNGGRYRTPTLCRYCASATHDNFECPSRDEALGEQIRADEAAAINEIAKALTTKVVRAAWVRAALGGFRKACRIESQVDSSELIDFLKNEVRHG